MPSLRQLLSRHPRLLIVDTCATRVEASVWLGQVSSAASVDAPGTIDAPAAMASVDGEASSGLPEAVARVLRETGLALRTLDAVAFCAGPGSVLGVRLAAASLRAWRALKPELALYAFHSLPLVAAAHPGATVVADARRESWHLVGPDAPGELRRVSNAELAAPAAANSADLAAGASAGERVSAGATALLTPAGFRRWSTPPDGVELREVPYSAAALLGAGHAGWDGSFFQPAPEPDAFMHEAPSYVTWTPRVHQAPPAMPAARAAQP